MKPFQKSALIGSLAAFTAVMLVGVFGFGQVPKKEEQIETTHLIDSIQGPALYKAYCAVCHGSGLKGDGPMGSALKHNAADLTRIEARNGGTFPLPRVRRIISGDELLSPGALSAAHGTREMPVWGPIFSQVAWDLDLGRVRVDNLARYIQEKQEK